MNGQEPLTALKGVGEKTARLFERLGVRTLEELWHYYPRAYDVFQEPRPICGLEPDTVAAVKARLKKTADVIRYGRMQVATLTLHEQEAGLSVVWYNMPYLRGILRAGEEFVFRGRVVKKRGRLTMEQPEIFRPQDYLEQIAVMRPVYGQTKGLGNKTIEKAVKQALSLRGMEKEYLPEPIRARLNLAEINFALEHIHFPRDEADLLFARRRLVFDEFFLFLLSIRFLKDQKEKTKSAYPIRLSPDITRLEQALPYELTGAQKRALSEVFADLSGGHVMNRLIQGDVGSGKTIVAVLALLQAASCGYQGALMVPTEVLARQHFEMIRRLTEEHGLGTRVILLTGSMTAKEKRLARAAIEAHEADLIVGTHALIQEAVRFDRLALVITDEQHRFGVGQRESLGKKGEAPHVLVMSATPIPRTLAIILYGDLDISVIDELPAGRRPVKNCVVGRGYRENAYRFIQKEVEAGRQAYVICPMVEAGEMLEAENVIDYAAALRKKFPPSIAVEFLHGRMKAKEKNAIMERFAAGEIQVLVSTTVIEVGINVPNATVMMIENAERYGLAQLHQLRGRVGRGADQSYCIMVNTGGEEAQKRLEILNRSNDGFFIASEDLRLRGPGDMFGVRQSGELEFGLADIFTDAAVLKTASEEVNALLAADPGLSREENAPLGRRLAQYLEKRYGRLAL